MYCLSVPGFRAQDSGSKGRGFRVQGCMVKLGLRVPRA